MKVNLEPITMGEKLRYQRFLKSLSIAEAAEQMGIKKEALNSYELDMRRPRDEIKVIISKFYDCSIMYLFFE